MTTIDELVVQDPPAASGVPIQAVYGSGQMRLVVQMADPSAGSAVTWYDVTGYVSELKWKRGADQAFGRYRACQPELLFWGSGDQFARWNEDTSATFGTHVTLRGGLLVRAVVFRVVSGSVNAKFELFTGRVKVWGDGLAALGKVRFHRVQCIDTMSKLVNKPLPAQTAEGWRPRLNNTLTEGSWQFGADIYGAETVDGTPVITLDDRDEVPSAIGEIDATLDPVGLVWRTRPNGRLLVHPAPWTTFHDDIFDGAGTIVGNEWESPTKTYYPVGVRFSYQPVVEDGEVGFWPQVDGQSFGIESDIENVINQWKVTFPDGMGGTSSYSYDDPVSDEAYDTRPFPAATWSAQNDDVVDDYVNSRAYADMIAQPLRTGLDLPGFFPACALLDQWDDVTVVHATGLTRSRVTATGWLRSIEHRIKNRRSGRISWTSTIQIDVTASSQADPMLPVENLAVTSIDPDAAAFSWTNPSQTITPTETQIRIPELSDQWLTIAYPSTSFAWGALTPSTSYRFQVRLVRVVDEITTNVSPVREVAFTTDPAVVPTPVDDGTTVVIPDPDEPGCTTDWKLEESDDNGETWTTTTTGDETDFVENEQGDLELDLSSVVFEDGLLYRLCTNQDCGDGPEGWVCSIPFQPACATPAQLSGAPFDDAVMFVPEVCGAEIFEAVTDTPAVPGPAFGGIGTDDEGNYLITSGVTGNVVIYGDAPNVPLEDGDRSIHWRGVLDTVEEVDPLLRVGRLRLIVIDVGSGVYKFAAVKSFAGGSITAIGTTTVAADTEYDVYATWDRSTATVAIVVDGLIEDSAEDAASYVNTPNLPTYSAKLPPSSWATELAAWSSIVVNNIAPTIDATETDTDMVNCRAVYARNISGSIYLAISAAPTTDKVTFWDVTSPGSISKLNAHTAIGCADTRIVNSTIVYVGKRSSGTDGVIKITNWASSPTDASGTNSNFEGANGVAGAFGKIYAAADAGRIAVANATTLAYEGALTDSKLAGVNGLIEKTISATVYLVAAAPTNDYVVVVGLSSPSAPTVHGSLTHALLDGAIRLTDIGGNYVAVLAPAANSVVIVDLSTPSAPSIAGSVTDATLLTSTCTDIGFDGTYCMVTDPSNDRVVTLDVSTPSAPFVRGYLADSTNLDLAARVWGVSGKFYVITPGTDGFAILTA